MGYLILGGTGTVGSEVVRELRERGEGPIRVLTRSDEKADELPDGVEGVVGDLTEPAHYDRIFADAERLFLLNGLSPDELQQGLAALNEAKKVGTGHLVYLSVHDVRKGQHVPHFASKVAIEDAIAESGLGYTILQPNNFYQNDHWFREAIVDHGVYPQPFGDIGSSRVDVRDIGEAAANAFVDRGPEDRAYTLAGPDALTGEDCARIWSEALGKEVRFAGNDLDAWYDQALQMLPAWLAYDFRIMYAMFQEKGFAATDAQLEETRTILGHEPRSFEAYVKELSEAWG